MAELLVEMMTQPRQFFGVAQVVGNHHLVILLGEGLVGGFVAMAGHVGTRRTTALAGFLAGAGDFLLHAGFGFHLDGLAARGIGRIGLLHATGRRLALFGILAVGCVLRPLAFGVLVLAPALVVEIAAFLAPAVKNFVQPHR